MSLPRIPGPTTHKHNVFPGLLGVTKTLQSQGPGKTKQSYNKFLYLPT